MSPTQDDLKDWLSILGSQSSLSSSAGLSAWHDGLALLETLQVSSFARPTEQDLVAFEFLRLLRNRRSRDFDVVGDSLMVFSSPLYSAVQDLATARKITYSFVKDPEGSFEPWSNHVELGSKYVGTFDGRSTVPFYSFNHENAHVALFGTLYSDLQTTDAHLEKLLLLIEWFCISLDLILALDLKRSGFESSVHQLDTITPSQTFFTLNVHSLGDVDHIANRLRESLINGTSDNLVNQMISPPVIQKHRTYAREKLLPACRNVPSKEEFGNSLFQLLETENLSRLVKALLGLSYAA